MKKTYFIAAALLLGAATVANAEGTWKSVTGQYLQNPSMMTPDWNGGFAAMDFGVAEAWSSNFGISQVLDLPAGHYKMTVNAFYRYGAGEFAVANTADHLNAFIFLGTAKKPVMSLYAYGTDGCPNSLGEANDAFSAGKYVNEVEFDHPGGDLKLGIANPVFYWDEWCAFDNFKLTGPNGDVEVPNGDFSKGRVEHGNCGWDNNGPKGVKTPDHIGSGKDDFNQYNGCVVGTFRKAGGSPYNHGQYVDLPAGKYRFGAQAFVRYGCGNQSGWWVPFKNGWDGDNNTGLKEEGESAYDKHVAGCEIADKDRVFLYATNANYFDETSNANVKPTDEATAKAMTPDCFYIKQNVKCIFDEEPVGGAWPDNVPPMTGVPEGGKGYANSGIETYAVEYFINNPDSYRNYVEFELAEPTKVWVGINKSTNEPEGYWSPYREFTLEQYVDNGAGVSEIMFDENAPVEYFNLQGVRVANPSNGIFIVKQGNKVTKRVIR